VSVDGISWSNVKFFAVSQQWPSHTKGFPVVFPDREKGGDFGVGTQTVTDI
jgi:hypothetical protein